MSDWSNPEIDRILVPVENGEYQAYSLMNLLGLHTYKLRSTRGFGLAPLHFITTRGPQQDGETPIDMRLDPRIIQIGIEDTFCSRTDFWDNRNRVIDLLRPTRSFNGAVRPLVYRKIFPQGRLWGGTDGVVVGTTFTSVSGQFVTKGGLGVGDTVSISGTPYVITYVQNDSTLVLASAPGDAQDLEWTYRRKYAIRDLFCLLAVGPSFNEGPGPQPSYPTGYNEVLRFIAHDPVWYGIGQEAVLDEIESTGGLLFYNGGAWFGATPGAGAWVFDPDSVGVSLSVVYCGTDPALPVIEITGPADSVTITNTFTGVSVSYTAQILSGVKVLINLLELTATDNSGANLFPFVSGDVSLFNLSPPPQAPGGVNTFSVGFTGATTNTSLRITWQNRFIGI